MKDDNEYDTTKIKINQSLKLLDQYPLIETPSSAWFENFVQVEKKRLKKKLYFDILLFLLLALFLLIGLLFTMVEIPLLFVSLQVVVTIILIIYTGINMKKQVRDI